VVRITSGGLSGEVNKASGVPELDGKDGSVKTLYEHFKKCLENKNIPLQNIVGLACNGASVMVGSHNSFFTHLKAGVPHIILLKCICIRFGLQSVDRRGTVKFATKIKN
jgi:hypothetical protein